MGGEGRERGEGKNDKNPRELVGNGLTSIDAHRR